MPKPYKPGNRKIIGTKVVLSEAQYRQLLKEGKPVPQGAQLIPSSTLKERTLKELRIRFHKDGSMELPYYGGPEGKLKVIRFLHAKTVPEGIKLVCHQIDSVKSSIEKAERIADIVGRLHFDLENNWKGFNQAQKESFSQYFYGILGELAKNPLLLRDENKIHACKRFERAVQLLKEGNAPAASAVMNGIKNNMGNWLRKMKLQLPRIERRRKLIVDKKLEKDKKVFSALDSLIGVFNQLRTGEPKAGESVAAELSSAARKLQATGLSSFKQAGIIVGKAAELARKGEFEKARRYIKDANQKIILAASSTTSIYPNRLREIARSPSSDFKTKVLANQTVLFHDMMEVWWSPKDAAKRALILETVSELSRLAEGLARYDVARLISEARSALEKNKIAEFSDSFSKAASLLKQGIEG